MDSKPSFAVVGAGMVGTCCALSLQNEGFDVTLVDRGGPGEEASFGNLGGFGVASCPPAAMPGILRKAPGMLLDADAPLKLRWGHAVKALPWFLRFAANARRDRVEANAAARQSLLDKVHEAVDPLIAEAGAQQLDEPHRAHVHLRERGERSGPRPTPSISAGETACEMDLLSRRRGPPGAARAQPRRGPGIPRSRISRTRSTRSVWCRRWPRCSSGEGAGWKSAW